MDPHPASAPSASIQLGDIYYTLFRHKWKIILCSLAGLAAAGALYKLRPPPFQSEAKLFIRYVVTEGKSMGPGRDESTKSPDQRGETIMSSEVEILSSLDLAEQVAKNVGPEKILGRAGVENAALVAAGLVKHNLEVEVPRYSSIIQIKFQHPDAEVVQVVLREVVASYLKKHNEIRRAGGIISDSLTQETDQLRARLAQTEEELRKAMNKAGITSLEDYKKSSAEQIARLRQQIFDLQAELAERTSVFQEMTAGATPPPTAAENAPALPAPVLPDAQVEAYQKATSRLALLRQRLDEALLLFTEENPRVQEIRAQLAEVGEQKKKLEADFPALTQLRVVPAPVAGQQPATEFNPATEAAKINSLKVRLKTLVSQMEETRADAVRVDQMEISILELRRRKELEEANYRYYYASLEQSRINDALGAGRVSNISQIETPTPPTKDWKKTYKLIGAIAASGIGFGLFWAFAIEFYFDRTVRRPGDVERVLRLPLFLSIPKIRRDRSRPKKPITPVPPLADGSVPAQSTLAVSTSARGLEVLDPYHETLRDRLISYFESINLRHKPKLVAVTGLGQDSGVTTTAAGLARSLSEIGEGNVLLVDMTQGQGSAQHFHKGAFVALDHLLDTKSKDSAQVQDNLYVVTEASSSARLAKGMPQRFNQLIPKLKASDFDYIIFDMPPVSQISITPRLAGFMDMVLLVIESEKTDREIVQRATDLLAQSKAKVGAVLNKTEHYVPQRLHQDREFLLGA